MAGPAHRVRQNHDYGRARATLAKLADQTRQRFRWGGDDCKVWGLRQARDIRVDGQPIDREVMRVNQHHLPGEPGATQVTRDHAADGAGTWGRADQRYRSRFEQLLEVAD
jgi:hypothetical protein